MANFYPPFYDQVVLDQDGKLAVGGTLEAFYQGTSNPAPIYNESGSEITQPLAINSDGRLPIYKLDENLSYRLVLKDSMGVVLRDADGIKGSGTGGGTPGGSLWEEAVVDGNEGLRPINDYTEVKIGAKDMTNDTGKLTVCGDIGASGTITISGTSGNTTGNVDGTYVLVGQDGFGFNYWRRSDNVYYLSIESTGALWYCIDTIINPIYFDALYTNYAIIQQPTGEFQNNPFSGETATVEASEGNSGSGISLRACGTSKFDQVNIVDAVLRDSNGNIQGGLSYDNANNKTSLRGSNIEVTATQGDIKQTVDEAGKGFIPYVLNTAVQNIIGQDVDGRLTSKDASTLVYTDVNQTIISEKTHESNLKVNNSDLILSNSDDTATAIDHIDFERGSGWRGASLYSKSNGSSTITKFGLRDWQDREAFEFDIGGSQSTFYNYGWMYSNNPNGDSWINVGSNTELTTSDAGWRVTKDDSTDNVYLDHKTKLGGIVEYRVGEGSEHGSARSFMRVDPTDGSVEFPNTVFTSQEVKASESTQLIDGGALGINDAVNGIVDVGASVGQVVDVSDINNVVKHSLDAAATTYTIPLVDRQNNVASYVYYYWTGSAFAISHKSTMLTDAERRDFILLGVAVHSTAGGNLEFTNDLPLWGVNVKSQLDDLMEGIKAFNLSGNVIGAESTNLNISKTAGDIFKRAVSPNTKNPNSKNLALLNSSTQDFRYRLQDGTEYAGTANVDPNNYDNNGVLTSVPTNDWTIQRVAIFSSNQIRIQYGQSTYNTKTAAIDGIFTESFTYEDNINANGVVLSYIVVKQGATNLSNSTQAVFYQAGKFGGAFASGSGLVNLQEAYNNSTIPQILTSQGALTLQGGQTDADKVIEVQNVAGTETFSVLANGVVQLKSTTNASPSAGQLWNDGVKIISDGALKSNDTIGVGGSKTDSSISNWETSRFKPFVSESFGIFGDNVGAGGGFVTNAYWNGTGWQAPDSGKCQYALFSGGSGDYIMYGFEASAPFESITWSERFRIGAGGVLSLASTTNASPTAGQLWNDGTRLNIYGELLIDGGTNTNFRVGSNLSNLGGEPAFRVLTTDFATYIDARADSTGDGITFRCGNQTEQGFAREYMKVDPSTGNVNFKQVLNVEATANVSPSLADIWNESTRLNVRGDFHVNGDTLSVNGSGLTNNSRLLLGDETSDATDNQTGYRVLARSSEGDIFVDHKTKLTKVIKYRCGEGAEQGFTHTFMEVDPTDGSVTFPNSSFGGGSSNINTLEYDVFSTGGDTSWSGNTDYEYTITVSGAAVGDGVVINVNSQLYAKLAGNDFKTYSYVSAADTVKVIIRATTYVGLASGDKLNITTIGA